MQPTVPISSYTCLKIFDDFIFAFFALEMSIKMVAMGVYGKGTYLADSWNRLDFFIVIAGALEYCLNVENMNLSAIRTIRVLRPLRAINRIPSMRILVMLLLDTLPMLGNVLLLCFFVFFIFGIVGVQLWEGILRQRCYLKQLPNISYPRPLASYYTYMEQDRDYICSKLEDNGMHQCNDLPHFKVGDMLCNDSAIVGATNTPSEKSCVNWNQYYTECKASPYNPFQGTISFDNIGLAWVAIFLVISLEGWTDIMYYVQDAHSFWDWIYFVLLIVIGSFFMINLCLVVIATQFSETKKREMERMRLERERFRSTSTLASSTNNSEPTSCYAEIVKYVAHLWRRNKRRLLKKYRLYKYRAQQLKEQKRSEQQTGEGLAAPVVGAITLHQYRGANGNNGSGGVRGNLHHHLHHHHHHHHHHGCHAAKPTRDVASSTAVVTSFAEGPPPGPPTVTTDTAGSQSGAPRATPEVTDIDPTASPKRLAGGLLRIASPSNGWGEPACGTESGAQNLLSPAGNNQQRRPSSVMFSDVVLFHGGGASGNGETTKNVCSSEKMTQTGDENLWPVLGSSAAGQHIAPQQQIVECGGVGGSMMGTEAMTCQELLALSGALSAALPTGQLGLGSFFSSFSKGGVETLGDDQEGFHRWCNSPEHELCCSEQPCGGDWAMILEGGVSKRHRRRHGGKVPWRWISTCCCSCLRGIRRVIKAVVEHKYFQQGILLAILINTLSMGIEYHNQPDGLTVIVEISNIVFSAIFAVEMVLKVVAEGPFSYISNGFNVFDGVIVVLSVIEMCQTYLGDGEGSSGLSVLRTFRLLRILKLVRFMPNLRRQLFVMLRTMDNVAVFFSLLILFIFIFSILGMYLFGGKFCMLSDGSRECNCDEIVNRHPKCVCDRKHFNNILWATVTVFQILTQEDWNVVLFNGMEKTSHWAALYFVALMTFGNYVLFNLLVAILVEGFSSERNERREREQRELAKQAQQAHKCEYSDHFSSFDGSRSSSSSESDSYTAGTQELKNRWRSAEELRKTDNGHCEKNSWKQKQDLDRDYEPKCNIQKESKMLCQQPIITHTVATPQDSPNTTLDSSMRDFNNRLMAPALYASSTSIDSIDRSMVSKASSSQHSIPGLLKPPNNKFTVNNLSQPTPTLGRRVSLVAVSSRRDTLPSTPRIQRVCSWKLSRPSLRRKSRCGGSEMGQQDQLGDHDIILNNNNILSPPGHCGDHSHCNGGLLGTIRNDTQGTPNNNRHFNNNNSSKGLSPQNSIRSSRDSPGYCPLSQVSWVGSLTRQNSLSSSAYQPTQSQQASQQQQHLPSHQQLTPQNSLSSYHSSVYNGGRGTRSSSIQYEDSTKPINNLTARAMAEASPLPRVKQMHDDSVIVMSQQGSCQGSTIINPAGAGSNPGTVVENNNGSGSSTALKKIFMFFEPRGCLKERDDYSLYLFPPHNRFRIMCRKLVDKKWFDNMILLFIALNCITLAMERPNIPPDSTERMFLATANYVFTVVFAMEMFVKVITAGMVYGREAYFTSGWNIMDGSLVIISIIDLLMSLVSEGSPRIFNILRVFRLLRSLRPLRVINRAPGLKLVVQTLLSSLRPIGNIVLICCTFFIIFGILGVQLFKGAFYYCEGPDIKNVRNRTGCEADSRNVWINRKYNFDDLGKALMSLFVLSSRDGWVNIMYTGLDAVGVDQQPIENYSEWRLLYFIAFILLVGFFVLNMFVGVVVENFHRCREEQEKEERVRRAAKRAKQMEKKRRKMHEPPYYTNYSHSRLMVHNVVTSKYFDLAIAAVIGLNVVTMAMEFYLMPKALTYALKIFNYFFTAVFILESVMKLVALGLHLYFKDKWNQLDVIIVILSIVGIVLEEVESKIIPINPTIIRVMRVLRIARVLKLLKMAKGIRALLDTVMQALPQVGNLGLLFFLLFFIFAALGVELFGRLECSEKYPCQGLGEHAHFSNFGMAFLTLFRVATGDNWNGIMKDTLRDDCDDEADCVRNCCVSTVIAPIFFVIFVLMAQFVLVNVVVAVLMKHLEESHKHMEDELDMEVELERELAAEQVEVLEEEEDELRLQQALEMSLDHEKQQQEQQQMKKPLSKVLSLPANFTFSSPCGSLDTQEDIMLQPCEKRRGSSASGDFHRYYHSSHYKRHSRRRQTFHSQDAALLPPGIPPAYPATGYTAAYNLSYMEERRPDRQQDEGSAWLLPDASKDREEKARVRRVGSDPPAGPGFLSVPKLQLRDMGSTKRLNLSELLVSSGSVRGSRHELWLHPHSQQQVGVDITLGSPSSAAPSEDVSPECVSPAVMLVPPPYRAATQTTSLQLPPSVRSASTTPDEDRQTDFDTRDSLDEVVEDIPRRRTSTVNLSVDSETGFESTPKNLFNLRSASGSSSDVPPDTDATSGDTNPRQTSSDTTQPYASETDTVPSSSQLSVEDDPDDAWTQQSPLETSAETIAVPAHVKQQVREADMSNVEGQVIGCVRDMKLSSELYSVQADDADEQGEGESNAQAFGDERNGSKERLVASASSEECCEEQLLLPLSQSSDK
ncbi:voltage-dependent T-type calcium channel subunit alpha-1H-like isoform X2 [Zootermopsis nevadensis]|uniref:voltage-dependent T-type calcium channel subunit alpha-1H-like isoform X2 n=1 Tax=Zootermopsis nevadensis TaxID=136037 RepID=UPI000B8E66BA|nr:voltage-dependent T-type calcium channel subunit alpha-1H-like isoform X2 [Zootermopsis nevadensis]